MTVSDGEAAFLYYWRVLEGPDGLIPEHFFHPTRRWRFDFAHLDARVAIEIDGGTWINGRHNRAQGYRKDCEKLNAAAARGWLVFRFTPDMLLEDPDGCLAPLMASIKERTP